MQQSRQVKKHRHQSKKDPQQQQQLPPLDFLTPAIEYPPYSPPSPILSPPASLPQSHFNPHHHYRYYNNMPSPETIMSPSAPPISSSSSLNYHHIRPTPTAPSLNASEPDHIVSGSHQNQLSPNARFSALINPSMTMRVQLQRHVNIGMHDNGLTSVEMDQQLRGGSNMLRMMPEFGSVGQLGCGESYLRQGYVQHDHRNEDCVTSDFGNPGPSTPNRSRKPHIPTPPSFNNTNSENSFSESDDDSSEFDQNHDTKSTRSHGSHRKSRFGCCRLSRRYLARLAFLTGIGPGVLNTGDTTKLRRKTARKLLKFSKSSNDDVLASVGSSLMGLTEDQAQQRKSQSTQSHASEMEEFRSRWYIILFFASCHPFHALLVIRTITGIFTDGDAVVFMAVILVLSVSMRFWFEYRLNLKAAKLKEMSVLTSRLLRRSGDGSGEPAVVELRQRDVVVGDIIYLSAGDMVPGDCKLLESRNLFVSYAAITGQTGNIEKYTEIRHEVDDDDTASAYGTDEEISRLQNVLSKPNIILSGTSIVSGVGLAVVVATGSKSLTCSSLSSAQNCFIAGRRSGNYFDIGIRRVVVTILISLAVAFPLFVICNVVTTVNIRLCFLYAITSVAALTPELFPTVVNSTLARIALKLMNENVIVKRLCAVQDLGMIDVICCDKTGTLTKEKMVLMSCLDHQSRCSRLVMKLSYLNAKLQTGRPNLVDDAICEAADKRFNPSKAGDDNDESAGAGGVTCLNVTDEFDGVWPDFVSGFELVDEIPFDFSRRRSSVVVRKRRVGDVGTAAGDHNHVDLGYLAPAREPDSLGNQSLSNRGSSGGSLWNQVQQSRRFSTTRTRTRNLHEDDDQSCSLPDCPCLDLSSPNPTSTSTISPSQDETLMGSFDLGDGSSHLSDVLEILSPDESLLICKGSLEEILSICNKVQTSGSHVSDLWPHHKNYLLRVGKRLQNRGMRVLGVSYRLFTKLETGDIYGIEDENCMVFAGFVNMFEPPRFGTKMALEKLGNLKIKVKVLTGDNLDVALQVCEQVGIDVCGNSSYSCGDCDGGGRFITGPELEKLSSEEIGEVVERTTVFAMLSPHQKMYVVKALRENGHIVGFLGDGINDALALRTADVGISVDSATDVAKEAADIILIQKSLLVIEKGVSLGRVSYANVMNYTKLVLAHFYVILVMTKKLLMDIFRLTMPWDRPDSEWVQRPKVWTPTLTWFFLLPYSCIVSMVEISSIIAMVTYHCIRTNKFPFIQSNASTPIIAITFVVICVIAMLPYLFATQMNIVPLEGFRRSIETYFPCHWPNLTHQHLYNTEHMMPASHWDILPHEIKSIIIKSPDPLTRYINHDLTPQEIILYGIEVWRVAFEIDYDGDLSQLPQDHFPNIHNGLKLVKSKAMYRRLSELKPSLFPNWWTDVKMDDLFILACSIGHFDMVNNFQNRFYSVKEGLYKAVEFGYLDIVKLLSNNGRCVGDEASRDFHVVNRAAANGHADVVSFLLERHALESSGRGYTWKKVIAFIQACDYGHTEVVKVLNRHVKVVSFSGWSKSEAMKRAVGSRKVDLVKYLVEVAGFNDAISCRDAFLTAVRLGFSEGVAVLAKVDGVDIAAGREIAFLRGHEAIVKLLPF
ncbi:hypothetical protein HDU76_013862 [Blyttiomyces sp. JEL0837]|nr:hypothetical protein HDU76_013862 [Blyttiomyces sp. JEL0837]